MGIVVVLTVLLSYTAMKVMGIAPVGVDDANILFVYSKHLAAGEGLVYNIGGERVEGFSSMLWMLITTIGYLLTDFPYLLFLSLNVLLVGGVLGYTIQFIERRFGDSEVGGGQPFSLAGMLFLAWVIGNPSYLLWTVASLMETGLWSALLISQTVFLLKVIDYDQANRNAIRIFSVLNAALILTRPEGIAWVLSFTGLLLVVFRAQGMSGGQLLKNLGTIAGISAATLAALIMFRLWYFGYPLPNTYYVKVTPDKFYNLRFGLLYFVQFIQASPLVVLFMAGAAAGFLRNLPAALRVLFTANTAIEARRLAEFSLGGLILVGTLLPVLMGGDIFGAFRFYQPIWPLFILVLFYLPLPSRWWQTTKPSVALAVSAVAIVLLTYSNTVRWPDLSEDRTRIAHLFELSERHILTGSYLHRLFDEYAGGLPTLAASAAGGIKIGYAGDVIDTMGLNFTPMAHHDGDKKGTRGHAAFNKDVFWQYPADLFEPTLCPRNGPPVNHYTDSDDWIYEIYRGMTTDSRFVENYTFVALSVPDTDDRVCTYMGSKWLNGLRADGRYGIQIVD
jgi:hypothetical protein